MSLHDLLHRESLLAIWHLLRAPILAAAVTFACRLLGQRGGRSWLLAAAGAAGVLAGWLGLFGLPPSAHALWDSPAMTNRLRLLALFGVVACAVGSSLLAGRERWLAVVLAVVAGWVLAGMPASRGALLHDGPVLVAAALGIWAVCALVMAGDGWSAVAGAATLLAALAVVSGAPFWMMVALVPLVCALALLPGGTPPAALLSVGFGIGLAAAAVILTSGRLRHGGCDSVDAAGLAPLLAVWVQPRLSASGGMGALLATIVGVGAAALLSRAMTIL